MSSRVYHWISLSILAELTGKSENEIRKLYRTIIDHECVPLSEIPKEIQDKYLSEYLLRNRLIDFSFLSAIRNYSDGKPLASPEVQELFSEMRMLREARWISAAFSAAGTTTDSYPRTSSQSWYFLQHIRQKEESIHEQYFFEQSSHA